MFYVGCFLRHVLARLSIGALLCLVLASNAQASTPMSREEFTQLVSRGVPMQDVVDALGEPFRKNLKKDEGVTELFYTALVLNPTTQKAEDVTVIIYNEYEVVDSVRWADGSVTE